ncbi:MAG TPA: ABC transporter ATP-binding protein [Syntrophorhabdales bacterium]|nr:ABC transporter ATP-binding protein [Syntrophorhabdales bacterium]
MTATNNIVLSVRDLAITYGTIKAVEGISFDVREGEIVTLIGANGAGKSSTLRAISGMVPYKGQVTYRQKELRDVPPHRIVAMGIAQVPEGRGIFGNLTVMENLRLATWQRQRKKDRTEISKDYERVFGLFPQLERRKHQSGGTLSGGEQQMLALGRAMMSRGNLMLLDEPSMGLAPVLVRDIFKVLLEINCSGTTILLVEQNARMALSIATRGHVLENGRITISGPGNILLDDPSVKEAYLGKRKRP